MKKEYGYDIADMHFFTDEEMTMEIEFEDLPEGLFERITGGVPIIRCKNCVRKGNPLLELSHCTYFEEDDYCSMAGRKKDE